MSNYSQSGNGKRVHKVLFTAMLLFCLFMFVQFDIAVWNVFAGIYCKPKLVCDVTLHDFGKVNKDSACVYTFRVQNKGNNDLKIEKVIPSCGSCIKVIKYTGHIPINGYGNVSLRLITTNLQGSISKEVRVQSNDPKNHNLFLTLEAEVTYQ
jgi:hypothetical protein